VKLLFILFVIPLVLACLLSQIAGFSVLRRKKSLRTTAIISLEKFRALSDKVPELKLIKRHLWLQNVNQSHILIKEDKANSDEAADHAYIWYQLGLSLLSQEHPASIAWRDKVIKTGYLLPPFVMIIVGMGVLVARIPPFLGIVALLGCLSLCTIMLWFNLTVELEAAKRAIHVIEKQRIYTSLAEEEAVVAATRAWGYSQLIPGVMKGFLGIKA